MKILMFCPDWFPYSAGLAQSCLEICQGLEAKGHKVRIICAKDKELESKGMKIIPIPYVFRLLGRNPIPLIYWNKIKKHVTWADKICLFSYMYEMNSRIVLYRKLGLFNKPIIHFYRGSLEPVPNLSSVTKIAKNAWDITFGRLMFTNVNLTISNSKPTIKYIEKKYNVPSKKLMYIPTGTNIKEYKQSKLNNKRVIFIGRLIENKGVKHFEQIAQAIPKDWKFTIIGDGPLKKEVLRLEEKYSQINYLGKLPHSKVKYYLGKSDILVLPSYAEGSPRAVLEAAASGVASIAFDVGDVSSVLSKNCLIPKNNINKLTKVLSEMIKNSTSLTNEALYQQKKIKINQNKALVSKKIEDIITGA